MKKTLKALLAMALIAAMLFALVACSGSKGDIVGTWTLSSMVSDGETIDVEQLKELYDEDFDCTLTVNSDGTAVLNMFDDVTDLEWKDGKMWAAGEEGEAATYKLSGGKLTLEIDGEKLIFKK